MVDTREKENKHIISYFESHNIPWESKKLDHGDYSFKLPQNEELGIFRDLYFTNKICIERKASLSEWCGNLVQDRAAVKKKFTLAPENTLLIIENGTYEDMSKGNYYGNYAASSYVATFHSVWNEFNIPIIFMPNNQYTGAFIYGHFKYYIRNIIK